MGVEELVEQYVLLNRASFPPTELLSDGTHGDTLGDAGVQGGMCLVLQKRDATVQRAPPRKPRRAQQKAKEAREAFIWFMV